MSFPLPPLPLRLKRPAVPSLSGQAITNLTGAWVLNKVWEAYVGVAFKFEENGTFSYWFYSDVNSLHDLRKYPITGTWKWNGPELQVSSTNRLYEARWHRYSYRGEICLLPEHARQWQLKDGKEHEDRLLFRIKDFDEQHPFRNRRR